MPRSRAVVVWPGESGEMRVVLVGSDVREVQTRPAHEARVQAALQAFAGG